MSIAICTQIGIYLLNDVYVFVSSLDNNNKHKKRQQKYQEKSQLSL